MMKGAQSVEGVFVYALYFSLFLVILYILLGYYDLLRQAKIKLDSYSLGFVLSSYINAAYIYKAHFSFVVKYPYEELEVSHREHYLDIWDVVRNSTAFSFYIFAPNISLPAEPYGEMEVFYENETVYVVKK